MAVPKQLTRHDKWLTRDAAVQRVPDADVLQVSSARARTAASTYVQPVRGVGIGLQSKLVAVNIHLEHTGQHRGCVMCETAT